ncbi:pyridoxal phosphate-dependent aminotransferase [Aerococcaceae bacterium DSM 111020]|nr:pyridoxal phosphate-dependent aminotransferase [Aerococcaceae bacterium DSM 111020]
MYQFDEVIDRRQTTSLKWNSAILDETFNNPEALPMWIADMDFRVAPEITNAIMEIAEHGIYGYSDASGAVDSFVRWVKQRHHWTIQSDWVINTPGVVTALDIAIQTFTQSGDKVLIQQPVYYPFRLVVERNEREVIANDLIIQDDTITIDFDDFELKASDPDTKLFILCSPHNPLGHLYSKEDLQKMFDICFKYNVQIVVDEIHGDLIMPGETFFSVGALDEQYSTNIITIQAPSKSFNLAGLQWSAVIIPNQELRLAYQKTVNALDLAIHNPVTIAGVQAAYDHGAEWLDQAVQYIYQNYLYMKEHFAKEIPKAMVLPLRATYLLFVDFSYLGLDDEELDKLFTQEIGLALDSGHWFGDGGSGYMRFNLATPRSNIEQAMNRLVEVLG